MLFSLNFKFEQAEYTCLVRIKRIDNNKIYKITIMNGELERMLYGENCIKEENGILEITSSPNQRQADLKYEITMALQQYLQSTQILLTE